MKKLYSKFLLLILIFLNFTKNIFANVPDSKHISDFPLLGIAPPEPSLLMFVADIINIFIFFPVLILSLIFLVIYFTDKDRPHIDLFLKTSILGISTFILWQIFSQAHFDYNCHSYFGVSDLCPYIEFALIFILILFLSFIFMFIKTLRAPKRSKK